MMSNIKQPAANVILNIYVQVDVLQTHMHQKGIFLNIPKQCVHTIKQEL